MTTVSTISKILWKHDPAGTCCNVNAGMEDEYDAVAEAFLSYTATLDDLELALMMALDDAGIASDFVEIPQALIAELAVTK